MVAVFIVSTAVYYMNQAPQLQRKRELEKSEEAKEGVSEVQDRAGDMKVGETVTVDVTDLTMRSTDSDGSAVKVIYHNTQRDLQTTQRSENGLSENIYVDEDGVIMLDNSGWGNRFTMNIHRTPAYDITSELWKFSMRFVAGQTGTIDTAYLYIYRYTTYGEADNWYFSIAEDSNGRPGATVGNVVGENFDLQDGGDIDADGDGYVDNSSRDQWYSASGLNASVTAGNVYHLVFQFMTNDLENNAPNVYNYTDVAFSQPRNTVWVDNKTSNENRGVLFYGIAEGVRSWNEQWYEIPDSEPIYVLRYASGAYEGNPYHPGYKFYAERYYYSDVGDNGEDRVFISYHYPGTDSSDKQYSAGKIWSGGSSAADNIWGENFNLSTATTVTGFEVPISRWDNPSYNLEVAIENSTWRETFTLEPDEVSAEKNPTWYRFTLSQSRVFEAGNYWIYLRARDYTKYDYYLVPLDNASTFGAANRSWDGVSSNAFRAEVPSDYDNLVDVPSSYFDLYSFARNDVDMPFRLLFDSYRFNSDNVSGAYTSSVLTGPDGGNVKWLSLTWDNDTPVGTAATVEVRLGDMPRYFDDPNTFDDTDWPWTGWKQVTKEQSLEDVFGADIASGKDNTVRKALQYRVILSGTSTLTPKVWNISVRYYRGVGTTRPDRSLWWVQTSSGDFGQAAASENVIVVSSGAVTLETAGAGGTTWTQKANSPAGGVSATTGANTVGGTSTELFVGSGSNFMKYVVSTGTWTSPGPPTGDKFKNGSSITWDNANTLYVLPGATYAGTETRLWSYNLTTQTWNATFGTTPQNQGPGGAIAWVKEGTDEYLYMWMGTTSVNRAASSHAYFYKYKITSPSGWTLINDVTGPSSSGGTTASFPPGADDGTALAWDYGDNIFYLAGAYNEGMTTAEESRFGVFHISTQTWEELSSVPPPKSGSSKSGVDDGGGIAFDGKYYIYGLKGGDGGGGTPAVDFWRFSISSNTWLTDVPYLANGTVGPADSNGRRIATVGESVYYWPGYGGPEGGATSSQNSLWEYGLPNYKENGGFTSATFDAGETVEWAKVTYNANEPTGTNVDVYIQSSSDGTNWAEYGPVSSGELLGDNENRYVRYRVVLSTTDNLVTPSLDEVRIYYTRGQEVSTTYWTQTRWDGASGQLGWSDVSRYYASSNVSGTITVGDLVLSPGAGNDMWGDNFVVNQTLASDTLDQSAERLSLRFRARRDENVYGVRINVNSYTNADVAVQVYKGNDGNPAEPGDNITAENTIDLTATGWVYVGFDQPAVLLKDNVYHIVLRSIAATETDNWWTQDNWGTGPTTPTLEVSTFADTYDKFFENDNVDWSQPEKIRAENESVTVPPAGIADYIVISEVFYDETGTDTNTFVELYNPTSGAVTLTSWYIDAWDADGTGTTPHATYNFPSGASIPSRGYYLIGQAATLTSTDFDPAYNNVTPDAQSTFPSTIYNDADLLALYNNSGQYVDGLAYGTATNPNMPQTDLPSYSDVSQGSSIERKSGATHSETEGNAYDTDDSSANCRTRSSGSVQPQKSTSATENPPAGTTTTQYENGWFTSSAFDATTGDARWNYVAWGETKPAGTDLTVYVRFDNTAPPWTTGQPSNGGGTPAWVQVNNENTLDYHARYGQYAVELTETDNTYTAELENIRMRFGLPLAGASGTVAQDNWAGGGGQVDWADNTKFDNSENIDWENTPGSLELVEANIGTENYGSLFRVESTVATIPSENADNKIDIRFTAQASKTVNGVRVYIDEYSGSPTLKVRLETNSSGGSTAWTKYAVSSGGTAAFVNPANVQGAPNDTYSTVTGGADTDYVYGGSYATESGTITQVVIKMEYKVSAASTSDRLVLKYSLDGGTNFGTTQNSFLPTALTDTEVTLDITSDTSVNGGSWDWTDISNLQVYCAYDRVGGADSWTGSIDALYVTITAETGSANLPSGTLVSATAENTNVSVTGTGWLYVGFNSPYPSLTKDSIYHIVVWDPPGSWETLTSWPQNLGVGGSNGHRIEAMGGYVYAWLAYAGTLGTTTGSASTEFYRYDPVGASWSSDWNATYAETAPFSGSYGIGIVRAVDTAGNPAIYILGSTSTNGSDKFARWTEAGGWSGLLATPSGGGVWGGSAAQLKPRNGSELAWDGNDTIYYFPGSGYTYTQYDWYKYTISTNSWAYMGEMPALQGPGNSAVVATVGADNYIFVYLGERTDPYTGAAFYRYGPLPSGSWTALTTHAYGADDGADLVWDGADNLYHSPGAWRETVLTSAEESYLLTYSISGGTWDQLADQPNDGGSGNGSDDGGSSALVGNYIYRLKGGDGAGTIYNKDFFRYQLPEGAAQSVTVNGATDGTNTITNFTGSNDYLDKPATAYTVNATLGTAVDRANVDLWWDTEADPDGPGGSATDTQVNANEAGSGTAVTFTINDAAEISNGDNFRFVVNIVGDQTYNNGGYPWYFIVDDAAPTNVGDSTPANGTTNVDPGTALVALTATDAGAGLNATPYYIELATNTSFTTGLQNSGWQAGTSWTPTLAASTTYYWRVKARDALGNESAQNGNPDTPGYWSFSTPTYTYVTSETVNEGGTTNFNNATGDNAAYENIYETDLGGTGTVTIFNEGFPNADTAWNGDGNGDTAQDMSASFDWYTIQDTTTPDADDIRVGDVASIVDAGDLPPSGGAFLYGYDADIAFGNGQDLAWVGINLSGYTSVQISYYWNTDDVDAGEGYRAEYSTNSTNGVDGTWNLIYENLGTGHDDVWYKENFNLPDADAVANFKLRFCFLNNATTETVAIDDVKLTGTGTVTAYRENVQHTITGIPSAESYALQVKYYTAGDLENHSIYIWNFTSSGWDNAGNLEVGAGPFTFENTIDSDHISGGEVRAQFRQPDDDSIETALMVDYTRVKSWGAAAATATATGPLGSDNNTTQTFTYSYTGTPTSVKLYYTKNGGTNWYLVGENTTVNGLHDNVINDGDGTYEWIAVAISGETDPPTGGTAPEAGTFILDTALPTISSLSPENLAPDVPVDNNVVIVFDNTMDTGTTPTLTQTAGDVVGYPFSGWSTTNVANDTATWTHSTNWTAGQTIGLKVSLYRDNALNVGADNAWSFTTVAAATATATGPVGSDNKTTNITLTYDNTGVPDNVELYYTTDGGSNWNIIDNDTTIDGSFNWTAPGAGTYGWYARAIGGGSTESAPTGGTAPEAGTFIIDLTLPTISSLSPDNGAPDVPADNNVVIVFSETMDTGTTPTLTQTAGTVVSYSFSAWSTTAVANDTATWTHNSWTAGDSITLKVSLYRDNAFNVGADNAWSFTTSTAASATATGPLGSDNKTTNITLTYDNTGAPDNVELYYTTDGGSNWNIIDNDTTIDGSFNWTAPGAGTYGWYARAIGGGSTESAPTGGTAPEAGTFIIDLTLPTISSLSPENLAPDVPVDNNVVIVFSETMDTGTTPTLTQTAGTVVSYSFSAWSTTAVANDTATWTHNSWTAGDSITLKVSLYRDNALNVGADNAWSFTTATAPTWIKLRASLPMENMIPYDNAPDTNANVLTTTNGGTSWIVENLQPIYILDYSDATYEGNPYATAENWKIDQDNFAGENFQVAGGNKVINGVAVYIAKAGTPPELRFSVIEDSTGTAVIANEQLASAASVGTSYGWVENLNVSFTLSNNTRYRFYLSTPGGDFATNYYELNAPSTGSSGAAYETTTYNGGNSFAFNSTNGGTSWASDNNRDVVFNLIENKTTYKENGYLQSSWIEPQSGQSVDWSTISFTGQRSGIENYRVYVQVVNDNTLEWAENGGPYTSGDSVGLSERYLRYRVYLDAGENLLTSPRFDDISFSWSTGGAVNSVTVSVSSPLNENMAYDNTSDNADVLYSANGTSWTPRSYQPIYVLDVDTTANGAEDAHEGNPYDEAGAFKIYSDNYAGVRFQVSGDVSGKTKVTRGVYVYVNKVGSPPDLSYTLQNLTDDITLASGTAATAAQVGTDWTWIYVSIENALVEGKEYRFYLSTTGGDDANYYQWMAPGRNVTFQSGLDDRATYDGTNTYGSTSATAGVGWTDNTRRDVVFRFVVADSFSTSGWLESSVFNAEAAVSWTTISVTKSEATGTSTTSEVRAGNDSNPYDGGWTAWQTVSGTIGLSGYQYIQYRENLSTSDPSTTPVVHEVRVGYQDVGTVIPPDPDPTMHTLVQTTRDDFWGGRELEDIGENVEVVAPGDITLEATSFWGNEFYSSSGFSPQAKIDGPEKIFSVRFVADNSTTLWGVSFLAQLWLEGEAIAPGDSVSAWDDAYWVRVRLVPDVNGYPDLSGIPLAENYAMFDKTYTWEWFMPYPRSVYQPSTSYYGNSGPSFQGFSLSLTPGNTYHIVIDANPNPRDNNGNLVDNIISFENYFIPVAPKPRHPDNQWINYENFNENRGVLYGIKQGSETNIDWIASTENNTSFLYNREPTYVLIYNTDADVYGDVGGGQPYYKGDHDLLTNQYHGQRLVADREYGFPSDSIQVSAVEFYAQQHGDPGDIYVRFGDLTEALLESPIDVPEPFSWGWFRATFPSPMTIYENDAHSLYLLSPSSGVGASAGEDDFLSIQTMKTSWNDKSYWNTPTYGGYSAMYLYSDDGSDWGSKTYRDLPFRFITGYEENGTFVSKVFDAEQKVDWQFLEWDETTPTGTSLRFYVRAGASSNLGGKSWSGPYTGGRASLTDITNSRYIQYMVEMSPNENRTAAPAVHEVRVGYRGGLGSIRLETRTEKYVQQEWVYEGSGVILAQDNTSVMYESPESMIVVTDRDMTGSDLKVTVNYNMIDRLVGGAVATGGITMMRAENFYTVDNKYQDKVEVTIVSDYPQAWDEYLSNVAREINNNYSANATVDSSNISEGVVKLTINGKLGAGNNDIYYYEAVTPYELSAI